MRAKRQVTVTVAWGDAARLSEVKARLGVNTVSGDIADAALARKVLAEVETLRPVLVLNAGAQPAISLIHEQSWEGFSRTWDSDVKAGFHWVQAALALPLSRGSRVLLGSSGAAVGGSPLSGGYAGAKRMLWLMAQYANVSAKELDLGITFQAVISPTNDPATPKLGRAGAEGYAKRKGVSVEAFLAGFGAPMSSQQVGEHVATILTDEKYESGVAFGLKGDRGISSLDG